MEPFSSSAGISSKANGALGAAEEGRQAGLLDLEQTRRLHEMIHQMNTIVFPALAVSQ